MIQHLERVFDADTRLPLPRDITQHELPDGHHVFVSAQKSAYIVTDHFGAGLVDDLRRGLTLRAAVESLCATSGLEERAAVDVLRDVLFEVEGNLFYEDATVVVDRTRGLGLHCFVTKRCTLSCSHCYALAGPDRSAEGELSAEEWRRCIRDYTALDPALRIARGITFTGGEPLLRRDLYEIAGYAKQLGNKATLFTNGTLIQTSATARRVAEHFDAVQISLDGATPEINDAVRGQGSFHKILSCLKLMAETKADLSLAITAMPLNAEDLRRNLPTLLAPFGARFNVRVGRAFQSGRAGADCTFRANWGAGIAAVQGIVQALRTKALGDPRAHVANVKVLNCGYGRTITIGSDGTVYACSVEIHPVGNLRSEPFAALTSKIVDMETVTSVDNVRGCRECDLRYLCSGSCRLNNVLYKGSLLATPCDALYKQQYLQDMVASHLDRCRPLRLRPDGTLSAFATNGEILPAAAAGR